MDPFGAGAALHGLAPPGHISSAHKAGKNGARVWMSITAHQEEENKEMKTCKRRAREKRKQVTDFKEAVCCPSAVVEEAA